MRLPKASALAALALTAPTALLGEWSLPELCWSVWLAGLLLSALCVLTGGAQLVVTAHRWSPAITRAVPALGRLPRVALALLAIVGATALTAALLAAYYLAFAFYGIFLSFFAEMEPRALFGRNGFINSDFWTPVRHLAADFWAMSVGTVVAFARGPLRASPRTRLLLPFETELVRVHVMVVVMPFLALGAWAVAGDAYEPIVVVLLTAAFYLAPASRRPSAAARRTTPSTSAIVVR